MSERILILGGTKEAAELAEELVAEGRSVITSLAGRTTEPLPVAGAVRKGGFCGADKLATWLIANKITKTIDATHPFARQISKNAVRAAALSDVALDIRRRQPWIRHEKDIWIEVGDLETAANTIAAGETVFLAIGSQYLQPFEHRTDVHFITRMINPPDSGIALADYKLILARPSSDWRAEAELFQANRVTTLVCRNSGGTGAHAKIIAARELAIPVIIIKMPA